MIDIDGLIEKAKAAYAEGPYDPRVGLTALEKEFCLLANPHNVLALCERIKELEDALRGVRTAVTNSPGYGTWEDLDSAVDLIDEVLK
ncbi:hypothetical protein IQ22_04221 [Pseudomonas duriflava]|uniref:Uncharacterized protein n=1 Tax=Pseudomonas duriflava TaxID=459528 RepID=A0A562PUF7_9PSED|nr:hypothetical protein [Pseudomonas duriflava]TWI48028.1 hypothetical protein IQ22_04221 [Pseudomonas duriflava]